MQKLLFIVCLFFMFPSQSFARTMFYEDYSFYGKLTNDIILFKEDEPQAIQIVFPSDFTDSPHLKLKGTAEYIEIDKKPAIKLHFDKLSKSKSKKYLLVDAHARAIDAKMLNDECMLKQSRYKKMLRSVNDYNKEFVTFPINRYKNNPTIGKPTANTFIMLLEPFYAIGGAVLYVLSPVSALIIMPMHEPVPDIAAGSMIEFEFLEEVSEEEMDYI